VLLNIEDKLRTHSSQYLYLLELLLYVGVGVLLSAAAGLALAGAGAIMWSSISNHIPNHGLLVLDQLLLVLMLVEILHTVRISVRSKELMLVEPFLIVGLIASIRRVLVITLQASKVMEGSHGTAETALAFRDAMIELGLLGFLTLAFVFSIYLLHRTPHRHEPVQSAGPDL
jgi:hypothetical protein